ncbi:lectin BRA-3-like isoform X1 [Saccostrea cucullata]|uniref:lectin BRA-3-like isoform X1 n=1 Tax=Saccostrea cuccullata TaxID=36930 RepID=UPI002ECFFC94
MLYEMHYYLQIKNKVTWSNAKVECEKLGAYLVTIDTEEENTWLTETFVPVRGPGECRTWWFCCSHWIGANDIEQEGRFVWTGNNRDVTSYSNWYPNEPDNKAGQDCVHMCREGIWGDYGCGGTYSYICEKD